MFLQNIPKFQLLFAGILINIWSYINLSQELQLQVLNKNNASKLVQRDCIQVPETLGVLLELYPKSINVIEGLHLTQNSIFKLFLI